MNHTKCFQLDETVHLLIYFINLFFKIFIQVLQLFFQILIHVSITFKYLLLLKLVSHSYLIQSNFIQFYFVSDLINVFSGGGSCTRERCGSMPSRSRTSSEGSVQNAPNKLHTHNCSHQLDGSLCPHITRPQSMYSPPLSSSYSPPFSSVLFRYLCVPLSDPTTTQSTLQHKIDFFPIFHCEHFC